MCAVIGDGRVTLVPWLHPVAGSLYWIRDPVSPAQQTPDIDTMLIQYWPTVFHADPALNQHWVNVSCFLRDSPDPDELGVVVDVSALSAGGHPADASGHGWPACQSAPCQEGVRGGGGLHVDRDGVKLRIIVLYYCNIVFIIIVLFCIIAYGVHRHSLFVCKNWVSRLWVFYTIYNNM